MANVDNPHGFAFVNLGGSDGHPPRTRLYSHLASYSVAIFRNDVVYQPAGVAATDPPPVKPLGDGGTPGTTVPLGVARQYIPASTFGLCEVIVDQRAEYEAQDDDDTDGFVAENMGLNALVSTGAGSTLTEFSGHEIDEAAIDTDTDNDVHLLRLYKDPKNAFGAHARILCRFMRLREGLNTVGV